MLMAQDFPLTGNSESKPISYKYYLFKLIDSLNGKRVFTVITFEGLWI